MLEQIVQALQGSTPITKSIEVNASSLAHKGNTQFRDFTVILLSSLISGDAGILTGWTYQGLGVRFLDRNATVKALVDKLLEISGMRIILPRPGNSIDYKEMEHAPEPGQSRYPSVTQLVRPGYYWAGVVFTKAQVRVM